MTPEDPRHGEPRGYYAHLRIGEVPCGECRRAINRYSNLRRMGRIEPQVSSLGTARRLQALMAIGWDQHALAVELGWSHTRVSNLVRRENLQVTAATAARVCAVYERLCMTPRWGTGSVRYVRGYAARKGWPPPLAWDDIDDPAETPSGVTTRDRKSVV